MGTKYQIITGIINNMFKNVKYLQNYYKTS